MTFLHSQECECDIFGQHVINENIKNQHVYPKKFVIATYIYIYIYIYGHNENLRQPLKLITCPNLIFFLKIIKTIKHKHFFCYNYVVAKCYGCFLPMQFIFFLSSL